MVIRSVEPSDAVDVAALSGELGYASSVEDVETRMDHLLRKPSHGFMVAEVDGHVVGFITFEKYEIVYHDPGVNVTGLVVKEEFRGRGIGKALLAEAEAYARKSGLAYVRLNSGSQRVEAHRFYRNNGYGHEKDQKRFLKELG